MQELEDFGIMTDEWKDTNPTYNLRLLNEYCNRTGKRPIELTDDERNQFRTN